MMTSLPGWSGSKFLPLLEINSNGLSEITEDFLPFAHQYALVTFYEQHNFPGLGRVVSRLLVPPLKRIHDCEMSEC